MLASENAAPPQAVVPTKPRSNPSRRRRAVPPALPGGAAAAKRPAESSTSSSSCLNNEIISTASTTVATKRPRRREPDPGNEAPPPGFELEPKWPLRPDAEASVSDCSEVVGGLAAAKTKAKALVSEVEVSESSCLASLVSGEIAAGIPKSERATDHDLESDLACSEQLASAEQYGDEEEEEVETSEYSSAREELTQSELEDELFGLRPIDSSDGISLPNLLGSSSSSDVGAGSGSTASPTFSLFLALAEQFVPCVHPASAAISNVALLPGKRFDELDDEESYELFRRRERSEAAARDFGKVYRGMFGGDGCGYGLLIMEQRFLMVKWIVEYSHLMELQPETLFMGVGLMDRFLTRGYFTSSRNLQILGIACITLATRIEENQPYNTILQRTFTVGINVFSRSEVVAMEWLVQEVLDFQCFVTTTQHFLWFYLKAAKADEKVKDMSKHLAVLSLLNHEQLSFWPSTIAAALVALACLATNNESSCHSVMETHMRTKNDDLPECIKSLEWLIKYAS